MKKILVKIAFTTLVVLFYNCSNSENSNITSSINTTRPTPPILDSEVQIGSQIWSVKNLNVSKYTDGTPIPQVTDPTQWANLTTGAWCYNVNNFVNGNIYGKLYNWYAVAGIFDAASATNPALRKKLAPTGWHIPTDAEWTQLTDCLGGSAVAAGKMKEIGTAHWWSPNTDATNSSGFTALPGGWRYSYGAWTIVGYGGYWWSSSELNTTNAWARCLISNDGYFYGGFNDKQFGFSVRCLRD